MFAGNFIRGIFMLAAVGAVAACASSVDAPAQLTMAPANLTDYIIGPGDQLQLFVWRNPELSATVKVRPDGRISVPLVEDLNVAGKTPSTVGREVEQKLSNYVKDPIATIIMVDFVGPLDRQVRIVGEAAKPQSIFYRSDMTVLDVLIQAGGLTQFAAGNRSTLIRTLNGKAQTYRVRLDDLIKDGDITANVPLAPGDVLIIPQSYF